MVFRPVSDRASSRRTLSSTAMLESSICIPSRIPSSLYTTWGHCRAMLLLLRSADGPSQLGTGSAHPLAYDAVGSSYKPCHYHRGDAYKCPKDRQQLQAFETPYRPLIA